MATLDTILTVTKHRNQANGVAPLDASSDVPAANLPVPGVHASTHNDGGSDEVTIAESQVTGLTAALAAKQAADATLTALAALNATAGIVEQTGSDAFTKRLFGVGASTSVPSRADADARYQGLHANLTALAAASSPTIVISVAVALTNAEILALPTTPKQLIAAPGAGFQILPHEVTIKAVIVGIVTNIDAAAELKIEYATSGASAGIAALIESDGDLSDLLASVATNKKILGARTSGGTLADMDNRALVIVADNVAAGVFTGGNAGNSAVVTVQYTVVAI